MKTKISISWPFGKQRFQGKVVWFLGNIQQTVDCDKTHATKEAALADAKRLLSELEKEEGTPVNAETMALLAEACVAFAASSAAE